MNEDSTWGDGHAVEVRYPLANVEIPGRETWPWLPGEILLQCGPDEWEVAVYDKRLAQFEDGSRAPAGTPAGDLRYPTCYRDSSEIREPQRVAEPEQLEAGQ